MQNLTETVKVRLDRPTFVQLVRHAGETDRPVGAVVRRAIREYLDTHHPGRCSPLGSLGTKEGEQ